MTEQDWDGCIKACVITTGVGFLLGGLVAGFYSANDARHDEHAHAVAAGAGRYEIDPATGKLGFVYLPPSRKAGAP